MIEEDIVFEIKRAIPEIAEVLPTNAPKSAGKPYIVYLLTDTEELKTLDDEIYETKNSYDFNVMTSDYLTMKSLVGKVASCLKSFTRRSIGESATYIKEVAITNRSDTYEQDIEKNRGIIECEIYF